MKVKIETITPKRAQELLDKMEALHSNPRKPIYTHVVKMARAISEDRWELNGESIKLNGQDQVVDGGNRLRACVMAGKSFRTLVAYGVADVLHADQGAKRSAAQILAHRTGIKNGAVVGSLARLLLIEKMVGSVLRSGGGNYQPDVEEVLAFTEKNFTLLDEAGYYGHLCAEVTSPTSAAYCFFKACTVSKAYEEAVDFFTLLGTGETTPKTPGHMAYRRLWKAKYDAKESGDDRMKRHDSIALMTKAFNATLMGERGTKFLLRRGPKGKWTADTFPQFLKPKQWKPTK